MPNQKDYHDFLRELARQWTVDAYEAPLRTEQLLYLLDCPVDLRDEMANLAYQAGVLVEKVQKFLAHLPDEAEAAE